MRTYDLSPLFRSTIGFDNLSRLLESATRLEEGTGYPPYNIEKHANDRYRITMAVAGFGEHDVSIITQEGVLVVSGRKAEAEDEKVAYLHRGIATRAFERRFQLEGHIKAVGASLKDGLLSIDLVREVPEAMKPRTIKIRAEGEAAPVTLEGKKEESCCGGACQ